MSRKKEKQEPYVYEYASKYVKVENGKIVGLDMEKINRKQREIDALANQPTTSEFDIAYLKAEIRRVNALLRENHNPHTYHQNKKYLERLERKLKQYGKQ